MKSGTASSTKDVAASPKSWEQTSHENKAYPACEDEDAYTIVFESGE